MNFNTEEIETSGIVSTELTSVNVTNSTEEQLTNTNGSELVSNVEETTKKSRPKKYPTPYLDKFNEEKIQIDEDKFMNVNDLWVSNCSLLNVALAVLGETDWLKNSENARDRLLYDGYMSIRVTYRSEQTKKLMERDVSIYQMAKTILELANTYQSFGFVDATINTNWRWTIDKKVKEERGFDPFGLAKTELEIKLKHAHMVLLVKIFRMYLMETVRRVFPKVKNPRDWKSCDATFKRGGIESSSSDFIRYVEELLRLYDDIVFLSPDLTEVKSLVENAVNVGKYEATQKREQKQKKYNMEANYRQTVNMILGTEDISSGIGKRKNQTISNNTNETNVKSTNKKQVANVWSKDKTLVDKYVERGEYEREEKNNETNEEKTSDESNPNNEEKTTTKRTIKTSNGNKQYQNSKKNQNNKFNKQNQTNQQNKSEFLPEELEKQGFKTIKKERKVKIISTK